MAPDEVAFKAGVFLLEKDRARALKSGVVPAPAPEPSPPVPAPAPVVQPGVTPSPAPAQAAETKTLRLVGTVPREVWNRLGTKLLPKLQAGSNLQIGVDFSQVSKSDTPCRSGATWGEPLPTGRLLRGTVFT